eukprot:10678020-Lingulodinium_polyedra.AAC.1
MTILWDNEAKQQSQREHDQAFFWAVDLQRRSLPVVALAGRRAWQRRRGAMAFGLAGPGHSRLRRRRVAVLTPVGGPGRFAQHAGALGLP